MTPSQHRPRSRSGAALPPDWDRAFAEQLPRVYSYFPGLGVTANHVEQHTGERSSGPVFLALEPVQDPQAQQKFQAMQRGSAFPADAVGGLTVREILQGESAAGIAHD